MFEGCAPRRRRVAQTHPQLAVETLVRFVESLAHMSGFSIPYSELREVPLLLRHTWDERFPHGAEPMNSVRRFLESKTSMTRSTRSVASLITTIICSVLFFFALTAGAPAFASVLASPTVPPGALGHSQLQEAGTGISARLLVESNSVQTDKTFRIGVLFDIAPGWHLYWRNPGDSGLPTKVKWRVDEATVGELNWPAPEVFHEPGTGFVTFGYDDQAFLSTQVQIHTQLDGPVEVGAKVSFLACKEVCIPGGFDLTRTLILGGPSEPIPAATEIFDVYEAQVPTPIDTTTPRVETLLSKDAIRPGDSFVFAVGSKRCARGDDCDVDALRSRDVASIFIPYQPSNPTLRPLGVQPFPASDEGFLVVMRGHIDDDAAPRENATLRGILALSETGYVEVSLPFPTLAKGADTQLIATDWLDPTMLEGSEAPRIAMGYALFLAFLGGLILNLMPCVLPVLAIKIVSLAQLAHQPRSHIAAHGLVYGAGIQASMGLLAAVVLVLREAGTAVGWGFQFQEPIFLAAITLLVVVFACNLFGWFEIGVNTAKIDGVGSESTGLRRSFFDGFLAVALATPCSAPFLGTAVGFAFAGGAIDIVLIFAGIGAGLALPFVATSLIPGASKLIPKAGPWMIRLRVVLGVALLVTGAWLLWILGRTAGEQAQLYVALLLLMAAAGSYAVGRLQKQQSDRTFALGLSVTALLVGVLVALPLEPIERSQRDDETGAIAWQVFHPGTIQAELASNRPVFVYFTADWCITCKVNERIVLEDDAVTDALEALNVATFRGDWTQRDEAIRVELARHGKAGVPVYLVYAPDRPDAPHVLPELITVDSLIQSLERAAARRAI
jgi:DsbC/DsbD-like thiol-disulfide interchange protein/cytochrome c biogenesis protein CcdA